MPELLDVEGWHLVLLDTEHYPALCEVARRRLPAAIRPQAMTLTHDPLRTQKTAVGLAALEERRRAMRARFREVFSYDLEYK